MNHLQKSESIEETCKDYLRNLSQSGHEVQTGDTWAILFLASALVYDMNKEKSDGPSLQNVISTMHQWAEDLHPEESQKILDKFENPKTARDIARVVFANVTPAGLYEPQDLLDGLKNGKVRINVAQKTKS